MKTIEYNRGDVIFRQGATGTCMYEVSGGKVGVFVNYGEGNEQKLTELGEDAFFGEMGMVEQAPRSATAVALSDKTVLREIGADDLAALFAQSPDRVLAILQHMSRRLRGLTADYLKSCQTLSELADASADDMSDELRERVTRYASVKKP